MRPVTGLHSTNVNPLNRSSTLKRVWLALPCLRTVRIRHGEFATLEPEGEAERADFEIRKITALRKLPLHFGPPR